MKKQSTTNYVVSGQVINEQNQPIAGLTVQAFDQDPKGENRLGKPTVTDEKGAYQIAYTDEDFRIGGRESGGADIIVRVFENDSLLAETKPKRNAGKSVTINLTIEKTGNAEKPPQSILTPQQQARLRNLTGAIDDKKLRLKFEAAFVESEGDAAAALSKISDEKQFGKAVIKQLNFTNQLSELTDDHAPLVKAFRANNKTNSLRDIALEFNRSQFAGLVRKTGVPEDIKTGDKQADPNVYANDVFNRLFQLEPTAVITRMAANPKETPISDKVLSGGVATFLKNQPETFNIKTTSIYKAFKQENAFKDINPEIRDNLITELKSLQRVAALSPTPEAIPVLMKSNMTSALRVSDMPETQFVQAFSKKFGVDGKMIARQVHTTAINARIRNEHALIALKEAGQGTGVAFIDKSLYAESIAATQKTSTDEITFLTAPARIITDDKLKKHNLSWDLLFADADFCECGECTSVYSAAAYFVELLQYLRNNNLDIHAADSLQIKTDPKDISDTPLEKLFNRRPDLGCLQLTCPNTNTILPYIDLVNEVMENYVVFHYPKPFNVEEGETSGELLAQPQHTEFQAYYILQKAVYPFTLPYHQPIDAARIFLDYLGTSRYEVTDVFRSQRKENNEIIGKTDVIIADGTDAPTSDAEKLELDELHNQYLIRAADAEFLGLTQEDYIILTKVAFVTKEYWDKQRKKEHLPGEYTAKINVKPVHQYYGFNTEAKMLSDDESKKDGLTFVKNQFLRRTGVEYLELVELLKTRCLNPNMPQGEALSIMESIRFSYRFLQTLVNTGALSPKTKYKKLIGGLTQLQSFVPLLKDRLHPDPCNPREINHSEETKNFEKWIYSYFERVGKIIVLENGGKCHCVEGKFDFLVIYDETGKAFLRGPVIINKNCDITFDNDKTAIVIGRIDCSNGKLIGGKYQDKQIDFKKNDEAFTANDGRGGFLEGGILYDKNTKLPFVAVEAGKDTCDLDTVRLIHLDGSSLTVEEYDHFHRFIRLWRKLGWTIDETDKALVGLSQVDEDCVESNTATNCQCEITPDFLHQLVAVKKLSDKTGLELIKLLTFWTNISSTGEKSLYKRLFLTHNLIGLDKVFQADNDGSYLAETAKITEHIPAVMAAFNISSDDIASMMKNSGMKDELTLTNLSMIYRYRLLAKVLGLKIPAFVSILPLFGELFKDADTTLEFIERWEKMEDAGFDYRQLNYVIKDFDDPKKPLSPTERTILQLAKTLYDGLNAIDETHKDLTADPAATEAEQQIEIETQATTEFVRSKAALLFAPSVVEQIISILEGTSVFITNAPKNFTLVQDKLNPQKDNPAEPVSDAVLALRKKIKYDAVNGSLQIIGILTPAEKSEFETWSDDSNWSKALIRLENQQHKLFKVALSDVFEAEKAISAERETVVETAESIIEEGDITIAFDQIPEGEADSNTAQKKRAAFLMVFLPYLRRELTHRFVIDTLSNLAGLPREVTDTLISEVLMTTDTPQMPIYNVFEKIKNSATPSDGSWQGYLIPSAEGNYTFIVKDGDSDNDPNLSIEEMPPFAWEKPCAMPPFELEQTDDPTNEWWAKIPVTLQAGKLYKLSVTGIDLANIYWKTATSSVAEIPTSALLPDFASAQSTPAFVLLKKAAILISGFNLSADEIRYFNNHQADFDGFKFYEVSLNQWLRLDSYTRLRNSLPETKTGILEFFNWTTTVQDAEETAKLSDKIADLTFWEKERIEKLIAENHFNLNRPEAFRNEINLVKLQKAIETADKIGMDIDLLFDWAKPASDFKKCRKIAESIQKAIRAQYKQTDWEEIVKPLNDKLRDNQKDALIAYLLQKPDLIRWGVADANGLFEYFLIDVQMDACMETSRIKQAISSVQLFVQRCLLGLEEEHSGIKANLLDRKRWDWMQRYRVWEANRKVFLYPENWIESNLRDDKSPFFKELESELLQKDINKQNVTDALKSYLYKVDEVANMEVIGLYIDGTKKERLWSKGAKLHLFARTRNAPYFFYYRYLALDEMNWYAWEKMQVDIPSYDVENSEGIVTGNGCYLTPVVWNGRLLIFFPQIFKKTKALPNSDSYENMSKSSPNANKPVDYWEIKMGWSELRNGKWTQKQLSNHLITDMPPDIDNLVAAANDLKTKNEDLADKSKILDAAEKEWDEKKDDLLQKASSHFSETYTSKLEAAQAEVAEAGKKIFGDNPYDPESNDLTKKGLKRIFNDAIDAAETAHKAFNDFIREPASDISKYEFVPVRFDNQDTQLLGIRVFYDNNIQDKGVFEFNGTTLQEPSQTYNGNNSITVNNFHYKNEQIKSLQINAPNITFVKQDNGTIYKNQNFYHPQTAIMLGRINNPDLEHFFNYKFSTPLKDQAYGSYQDIYHELKKPYSLYNWELFFHTPMMLADALSKAQQFEEAMKWYHYVFNPAAKGSDDKRFWQFSPFKEIDAQHILDTIFDSLQPNESYQKISEWRGDPFKPHLVARSRPVAYMKWVVMKYVDNLVAWGDYLFRQDTIESLNQATQLYVLAGHILGERPQMIPKRGKIKPQTYNSLLDKWDAFSNAMVELELAAPFSNQIDQPIGSSNGVDGLANVFGFASSLYFCIPNNPKLLGYWDTIADRLFKIRHCLNFEGIFRKLPLFEPPIDPALLVNAAAQGLSIDSVLNDLNTPMPNYRFYYLLQKALELCNELKSLGSSMLSAIEKKDNETLSLIRAKHETTMQNLMMEIKKQQLEEAGKALESLQNSRRSPEHRMKYYLQLIGEDVGKVPGLDSEFSEIANSIQTPVDESGLKLIKYEEEEMNKLQLAHIGQLGANIIEALSGVFHNLPDVAIAATPFGVGVKVELGGSHLGNASNDASKVMQIISSQHLYESTSAGKKGGFLRQLQDRVMQANSAGYEIKQIDKQITAQQIRIDIANQEITNQQKQIDNANEIEEFLKNKYTNEELYSWMRGNLRTLYHQVYSLAFELSKKAEKVFRFERGLSSSNFIQAGYWNDGYDGLLSGEQLYVGLKQLEAAYQENRGYDYEITKHISLRQINPIAILQLKETGKCEFELPEILFDMDYPGHFKRRIKSVSLSIPCIAGPYTNVNATLRLLENKVRQTAFAKNANDYIEKTEEDDDRFGTFTIPISAIAASSAQNDGGMFELNFKDERYLPFEGAGVTSKWRLELPDFRQFDYDTVSDVVIHLRYTSSEGGERLKKAAADSVVDFIKSNEELGRQEGLFAVIDLKHDLPDEWHQAMQVRAEDPERMLSINNLKDFLPFYVKLDKNGKLRENKNIIITDVVLVTDANLPFSILPNADGEAVSLALIKNIKGISNYFAVSEREFRIGDWKLKIDKNAVIEKALMIFRFILK